MYGWPTLTRASVCGAVAPSVRSFSPPGCIISHIRARGVLCPPNRAPRSAQKHVQIGYDDGASAAGPAVPTPEADAAPLHFQDVMRLPAEGDNVAICGQYVAAGTQVLVPAAVSKMAADAVLTIEHTVLEGHR